MDFVRSICYTARGGYQVVAIPACVSQTWKNTSKCLMKFDEATSTLSITPIVSDNAGMNDERQENDKEI
jgi:hypothetical protein